MNDRPRYFAHTRPGRPESEWQELHQHLANVAERAAGFAAKFGAAPWAHAAGRWHDLGKYSEAFQDYLRQAGADPHVAQTRGRVDHATAGAQHAAQTMPLLGHVLAFCVAGHHGGLPDARSDTSCLESRLQKPVEDWVAAPPELQEPPESELPAPLAAAFEQPRDAFGAAFFTRMVFSCLVDADFLDTEEFMSPARAAHRPDWPADILDRMAVLLDARVARFGPATTNVDRQRVVVREACLAAAADTPGFFSLTVPTGGGKTLSSLSFALRHALAHGLDRVIYVAPFTTIIEQNADEFRRVFEPLRGQGIADPVVEHHSNLMVSDDDNDETAGSRLASENWDAPLVVTTSVQFYESMFARRTSRCRKLHNIARSVVILDEAQAIPVDYLEPCLRGLQELAAQYGTTIVLCTATQPAVQRRSDFKIGIPRVTEIVPDPTALYERLRRVRVVDLGEQTDFELVERMGDQSQALCVVNTRQHARELFVAMGPDEPGHFHLSALMCPAHRSRMIADLKERLREGATTRVVSTQLIEAGVDIDFPVVFRSMAGLDSIAQAAGRCNRNGDLTLGTTYVFRSEHASAERYFADTAGCAAQLLPLVGDPLSREAIERYFSLYYWEQEQRWDRKLILRDFALSNDQDLPFLFSFREVARRFRLIEETGESIIVPWGRRGAALCDELRAAHPPVHQRVLRGLQRYAVQVPRHLWQEHAARVVDLVHERYPVLTSMDYYDERLGLCLDGRLTPLVC